MPTDWDNVELDYRTGIKSLQQIAEENDTSASKISEVAETRCWTQEILSPEDEATVLTMADQEVARFPCDSLFSPDDVKYKAMMTAGQVVKKHRHDITKMRHISTEMTDRLMGYLQATSGKEGPITSQDEEGNEIVVDDGKNVPRFLVIAGKDSAMDVLDKLSKILMRTVEMERQAYGLESMTIVEDQEGENQVAREIRQLSNRLQLITEQKAQRAEMGEPSEESEANSGN